MRLLSFNLLRCLLLLCLLPLVSCTASNDKLVCELAKTVNTSSSGQFAQAENGNNEIINSIFIQDNYAYIGTPSSFRTLDISNPSNPQEINSTPIRVDSIEALGDYVYLTGDELHIFDVSNPSTPVEVYCKNNPLFRFSNATVLDNYAYIPRGHNGLQIIDVSNPEMLIEASVYKPQTPPQFQLTPKIELTEAQSKIVTSVIITGNYAFVTENLLGTDSLYDGQISVLDISSPSKPEVVGMYEMPNNAGIENLFISNNYLLAATSYLDYPSAVMLDISEPITPVEVVTPRLPNGLIAFFERYALFAMGSSGLEVWDFSSFTTPVQQTWNDLHFGYSKGVIISGNYAYFSTLYGGLRIVDITNPLDPETVSIRFD